MDRDDTSIASTSTEPLLPVSRPPEPDSAAAKGRLKLTGYRLLVTLTTAAFGLTKAGLTYAGQSVAPNTLDWLFGVVLAIGFYWLGLFESRGVLPWLFDTDYWPYIAGFWKAVFNLAWENLQGTVLSTLVLVLLSTAVVPESKSRDTVVWVVASVIFIYAAVIEGFINIYRTYPVRLDRTLEGDGGRDMTNGARRSAVVGSDANDSGEGKVKANAETSAREQVGTSSTMRIAY